MSVSVWSHPLYWWYNRHSIYDITSTVYMAEYALYMTSHPRFMTSQHSTHDLKAIISHLTLIISDSTSTASLSSHKDYWSYNPRCTYDNTATICMTSYELHTTSHPLFMISHHAMTSHPLYSVITSRIAVIASTVAGPLFIVYWLYNTYYMCDMKPTICMTSQEFYMTSHSPFMT